MYQLVDDYLEVRRVFLDNSKAFYKALYGGLIFKLRWDGVTGKMFNI